MKKGLALLFVFLFCSGVFVSAEVLSTNPSCLRTEHAGDVNDDGIIDISDAIGILFYLFRGEKIACPNQAYINDDPNIDISDVSALLNYLFGDPSSPSYKKPIHINHAPFLAITPSLKSEVNFVSDHPVVVRLYDANFDEGDVVSCRGIARSESGEEIELFSMGDGVNPLSWLIEPYQFVLDLPPGSYVVETSCIDQAGNEGKDVTNLNLEKTECTNAGYGCKGSCSENEESSELSCTGGEVCCRPKPVEICKDMDQCCATVDKNGKQVYQCIEGCQLYSPSCSSLNSINDIFPEYDINGNPITHSWLPASSSYCNDPNANPPDAPVPARYESSMCELSPTSASSGENWQKISDEPSPSSTPVECKVKSLSILRQKPSEPINYFEGLWQTQKSQFKDSPGIGTSGSYTVLDPEWREFQDKLKNDLKYTEYLSFGFLIQAKYVGIKKGVDGEEIEVTDIDTKKCKEYQFKEVTVKESKMGTDLTYYGKIYPLEANIILKSRSLSEIKDQLKSKEEVLEALRSENALTKKIEEGCPISVDLKQSKQLCQDDHFYSKNGDESQREWSETFYKIKEDKEISLGVKIHNIVDTNGVKSMIWYDAPGVQISPFNREVWKDWGYYLREKNGRYVAVVENEDGLERMRCEISPIGFMIGYNKNAKPGSIRATTLPTKCECLKEEKSDLGWKQVGESWGC